MITYKLIIENKELKNVSQNALKWFYKNVLNGNQGPFTVGTIDKTTKAIFLKKDNTQLSLF